jgi:transglutaminase-like putative cysteine protease
LTSLTAAKAQEPGTDELKYYLRPTKLLPTDGIVRETAAQITRAFTTDTDKARAIYGWIVEHRYRNPKTRGCGIGDIRFLLESRDLGGKCADLNALYVALARAAGVPARDVYASAWQSPKWDTRAWALLRKTFRKRSTAAPRSTSPNTVGSPWNRPMYEK